MHIINATTTQTKPHSGIGQYSHNVLSEMVRSNPSIDFTLLLYSDLETTLSDTILGLSNVNVHYMGNEPGKIGSLFINQLKVFPALSAILSDLQKDGVKEEHYYFALLYQQGFPLPGRFPGLKVVLTVHDFAMAEYDYYSDRGGLYNLIRKQEYWYHMNRSQYLDGIITNSENTSLDYMKYYPNYDTDKIFSIMLGVELDEREVDISKYLPKEWEDRGYFIYMGGGIQKNKNSEGVVRAYAAFLQRYYKEKNTQSAEPPYLVIAGKIFTNYHFSESGKLSELIKSFDLEDNVIFTGFYEQEATYSLLSNSIAFIHLSLFEGFGIAVAEAMRAGKVVIVHDGTSYPEVVGDAGYLVDGTDADEVGDIIYKVYNDPDGAKEIGLRARERSFIFDWKLCAQKTMSVFHSISDINSELD